MKKKIVFVINSLVMGGTEAVLLKLIRALENIDYAITIKVVKKEGALLERFPSSVKIEKISLPLGLDEGLQTGSRKIILEYIKHFKLIKLAKFFFRRYFRRNYLPETGFDYDIIEKEQEKHDVAICFSIHFPFLLFYTAQKIDASRKAVWVHNDFTTTHYKVRRFKEYVKFYDKIFCVSKVLAEEFAVLLPEHANRAEVFYNIVDYENIKQKALDNSPFDINQFNILTIGRLVKQKGFDIALKALAKLKREGYKFKYYIIGKGELEKIYLKQAVKLGIGKEIVFLGLIVNPYPYIKNCDIYLQPSRHEGYCTAVNEAKILERPIVATRTSGMDEIINDSATGILAAVSYKEIYKAIKFLIDNPKVRDNFVKKLSTLSYHSPQTQQFIDFIES